MDTAKKIPTILVNGFLESGKTTYIMDCLKNDYFYKKGRTLLISFEEGETEYDRELLDSRNTDLVFFEDGDLSAFLLEKISEYAPDRLYVEMNAMTEGLREKVEEVGRIDFSITLIDGSTLPLYYANMRQLLQNMITGTNQVFFSRCTKESLEPFANIFRVMNNKASYLWEGPQGYHEKAFGIMVPFDINADEIMLSDADFTPFYLDALTSPEHYEGKTLSLLAQTCADEHTEGAVRLGRTVMTCCLADIQFLGFAAVDKDQLMEPGKYYEVTVRGMVRLDTYRQKSLALEVLKADSVPQPKDFVIGL